MKRLTAILSFIIVTTATLFAMQSQIQMKPISNQPRPKVISKIGSQTISTSPVSAFIDDTALSVFFNSAIGNATITITDSYGTVVEQITVDTYMESEIYLPTIDWDAAEYNISISYSNTTLSGVFQVE